MQPLKISLPVVAILVAVLFSASCARQSSYSTFEDCILSEVGSAQSSAAVAAISSACRAKFPVSAAELAAHRKAQQDAYAAGQAANLAAIAAAQAAADAAAADQTQ